MQRVVGIKFKNSGKVYTFSENGLDLQIGEDVVVDSSVGLSLGNVAFNNREIDEYTLSEPLKNVLRKATEKDLKTYKELEQKAEKDIILVKNKVKELGLEMKVVSAEYLLDGSKIVIEFSADDRVDFRDLLKELAAMLKVRIELHQVGQRDEVKIKGGIGPCGEICCCSRFLNDFEHVTVKMAKTQGLSLNPTKISGLCGRLMCCLAYENKGYEEILRRMPKVNTMINTPKGNGVVTYNDILRERVSVKISNGEDSFTVYDFALSELNGEEKEQSLQPASETQTKSETEKIDTEDKITKNNQNIKNTVISDKQNSKNDHKKFNHHRRFNHNKNQKNNK